MQLKAYYALAIMLTSALPAQVSLGHGEILILIGPPGSGKTLQAAKLGKKYKVPAISIADVLGERLKRGNDVPQYLRESVAAGNLIDDRSAIELVGVRIARPDAAKGFILDGYPASEAQAKYLDEFIAKQSLEPPVVLVLSVPDGTMRERLLKRGRADDTPRAIELRIEDFHRERAFLESWYKTHNTATVDASSSADAVFSQIETALGEVFNRRRLKTR